MSLFLEVARELMAKPWTPAELLSFLETLPLGDEDRAMVLEQTRKTLEGMAAGAWVPVTVRLPKPHDERLYLVWSSATQREHLATMAAVGWLEDGDPLSNRLRYVTHWAKARRPAP